MGKAEDLNSDIAEENMKQYLINSPINKDGKKAVPGANVIISPKASLDGKPQVDAMGAVPINSPKFG